MSDPDWRDDPRVGDVIRQRNPRYRLGRVPRRIIAVEGDRIETSGMAGGQRDGWMTRGTLRAYDLVERGPDAS